MISITRKFHFDAAHRLHGYDGCCSRTHGHRYVAEVTVSVESLNAMGMVIDFKALDDGIGGWIRRYWDHAFLICDQDPLAVKGQELEGFEGSFTMIGNPTAENMALYLFDVCVRELGHRPVQVESVKIWETPDCCAEVKREEIQTQ